MDDLRQKLFPIFLGEAERNLAALRQFLSYRDLSEATAEELETAFRAAHTLKGTANLVKAESICKIARRLEGLLEKHFEARTVPTPVEHEALKLATDWLAPLVSALQGNLQEPTLFVTEALQALDLAEAFPGRTPLVELLDSNAEQRSPQLDDPFAGDPELLPQEDDLPEVTSDPFAEDPGFGMEIDLVSDAAKGSESISDPFAGDEDFSSADNLLVDDIDISANEISAQNSSIATEPLPFDPFAEDSIGLELEAELGSTPTVTADQTEEALSEIDDEVQDASVEESESSELLVAEPVDDPFAEDDFDLGVETGSDLKAAEEPIIDVEVDRSFEESTDENSVAVSEESSVAEAENDPFGEDDDFAVAAEIESSVEEDDPFDSRSVSVAKRAEEFAESLLLPDREAAPRKDYTCCVFKIGERDYHLPINQMQEIADLPQLLPLPLAPPMVSGLINLRGQVLPVINLAILNQHQQAEVRLQRRLVVADYQGESLAFLADGVPYLSEDFTGEKINMVDFLSLYRVRGAE